MLALNDPTLFVLPHQRDFASAVWLKLPEVKQPSFCWTEPPRWLPLPADKLGATFDQFMQTNSFASYPLNFKPVAELSPPTLPLEPSPPDPRCRSKATSRNDYCRPDQPDELAVCQCDLPQHGAGARE